MISRSLQEMTQFWKRKKIVHGHELKVLDIMGLFGTESYLINQEDFMPSIESLTWILVALSLAGNVFVIKKNITGQWLWAIANIGWISFNLYIEVYSQAFLFAAYLVISIWGIIAWSREDKKHAKSSV
jgi:hypothetical protein